MLRHLKANHCHIRIFTGFARPPYLWNIFCFIVQMNARQHFSDTLPMTQKHTESPENDWRNYVLLAQRNALRIDQVMHKCESLQANGQVQEAITLYAAWTEHSTDPNRHVPMFNYGSLLQGQGLLERAEATYRQCLSLNPRLAQAAINLGLVLEKQGKNDEALRQWASVVTQGLLKDPTEKAMQVMALNHMGRLYEILKQYDLAEQALENSLHLDPKQSGVIQHWVHIRQKSCKWPVYKALPNVSANEMLMSTSPLAMLALTDDPVQQLLTSHAFVARTYDTKEQFLSKDRHYQHKKIRIGYVSGDFCVHAVGLLLTDLLESHDKKKFEVYGYDFSPEDGTAHRARLKQAFQHHRPIHTLTDAQVAEQVLVDEIDVLIDLHGLSSGARPGIFSLHPAKLQGTYLGFIGTTGMPWFDFVISDRFALPEELTTYFTEKPLYVDGSFIPLTKDSSEIRTAKRQEFGLPEDAFVMAAFGNVYKITPEMFETWLTVLKTVPHSVLWLMDDNPVTTRQLTEHAQRHGADLNRIVFTPRAVHVEYQARLKLANIFLDNFPYNCGSTTRDVLNAGVPLITLSGKTMISRMGGSILSSIGLSELISYTPDEYADICIRLSQDSEWMQNLQQKIALNLATYQSRPKAMTVSIEKQIVKLLKQKK